MKNLTIQDKVFIAFVAPVTIIIITVGIHFISQVINQNINLY